MRCPLEQPDPAKWLHMSDVFDICRVALLFLNIEVIRRYMTEYWARAGKWLRKTKADHTYMKPIDTFEDTFTTIQRLHASFHGQHNGTAGAIRVLYRRAKQVKYGRLYAYMKPQGPTLQMLNKILRRWVTSTVLRDFDFKNCHPSILLDLCNTHNIDAPLLREYVRDPTAFRAEIGTDGKMRVLAAIYMEKDRTRGQWLIHFAAEVDRIEAAFERIFHEDYNAVAHGGYDGNNMRGAFMARILQQYEAGLLHIVTEHVKTWGVAITAYVFDGFMIRKRLEGEEAEGTDAQLPDDFLARLNALVREAGFPSVVLEEKPIDPVDFEQYAHQQGMAWALLPGTSVRVPVAHLTNQVIDDLLGDRGVVQIQAPMCSGKSFQMRRVIRNVRRDGLSVIIVTSRQLLAMGWWGELRRSLKELRSDVTFYKDREEGNFNPGANPILVVEHESFDKVDVEGYDLVIFDEVRSACSTVISKTNGTNGSKVDAHYIKMEKLVRGARWVVGLDADVSIDGAVQTLMETFAHWRGEELRSYVHPGGAMGRTVRIQDPDVLREHMCKRALAGEVFGVCCGSRTMARRIHAMLVGLDGIGPDKVILYTAQDGRATDLLDVDTHWSGRIVIFTSRVTTGIDFHGKVESVYVFPQQGTAAPREMWQMSGRFRNVTSEVIWLAYKQVTAMKANSAMLRSDVDLMFLKQMYPLEGAEGKMLRDRAEATQTAFAVVSSAYLVSTVTWTTSDLLARLTAYDRVERAVTHSPVDWLRYFKYMARLKGYVVRDDDFASRPMEVDTDPYETATAVIEAREDAKMAVVDVTAISDDVYAALESLSSGRFVKYEMSDRLLAFAADIGVVEGWNHTEAYAKARIKRLYPDIASDAITPKTVKLLDGTYKQRYYVRMVGVRAGERDFIGLRERTESSTPSLVAGTGVVLRDMAKLAAVIGLAGVLDMDAIPSVTSANSRDVSATLVELRRGSVFSGAVVSSARDVATAFLQVFGIEVTFKKPNRFCKAYRDAEELAPMRMDAILRQKMGGAKLRSFFDTPTAAELPHMRALVAANDGMQRMEEQCARMEAAEARRREREPDRETCAANKRKHDEMLAAMHEERISALRGRARDGNGEGTAELWDIKELCCDSCSEWFPKESFKLKFHTSRWYRGEFACPDCDCESD